MGCCGDREKDGQEKMEQRWDYINLGDFKTKSCWTPFAYGWLLLMFIVSMSIYAVDTFTAINLIAFDRWSGQIQPAIPFSIARWIFAGCIIASFLFLFYRWWRAIRVMRRGVIAKSYLDPLAVRIESIRWGGQTRGYKRFLVFAELTKSRKGADYVALFAYFSYEAWMRVMLAEAPRQAVNAITLYSVMRAKLIPGADNGTEGHNSSFVQFWINLGKLADQDKLQAAILLGMLWSLLIWVLAFISLVVSIILYIIFLWHHIPAEDGTLAKYCRNKINRRLERVVKANVDKALKKENDKRIKQEAKAQREGRTLKSQPTLPDITVDISKQPLPGLSRQGTMTTLPEYESRPGSARTSNETAPPMPGHVNDPYRPGPMRNGTHKSDTSWTSYSSNAPLMSSAADMGVQTPTSAGPVPWSARTAPQRSATGFSQYSDRSHTPGPRPSTAQSGYSGHSYQMEPLARSGTNASSASFRSKASFDQDAHVRGQSGSGHPPPPGLNGSYFPAIPEDRNSGRFSPAPGQNRSFTAPEQHMRSFTPGAQPQRSFTPTAGPDYRPFNANGPPARTFTPGAPPRGFTPQPYPQPERSITPYDQPTLPTLPRLDTSMPTHPGYGSVRQGSATPNSGVPASANPYQNHYRAPLAQEYQSYNRPNHHPQQSQGSNRDSGVNDILNHY